MKKILNKLFSGHIFDRKEAREILVDIASGRYNSSQIVAFITAYCMRNAYLEEIIGFRDAMLELCIPCHFSGYETIDLCGTGGDGKNTFNISTLASFVLAGAGYKVTKHGNYGVSSSCGSSNVMEYLGYTFTTNHDTLKRDLDRANICFLHAPLFHPAMKTVAPMRKELGVKTFFNILGPMVNPSRPTHQVVGVFDLALLRLYAYIYQQSTIKYLLLHTLDGYDEISLTGTFKTFSSEGEKISEPELLGPRLKQEDILGGNNIEESAKIFINVLNNEATYAQQAVVIANATLAIRCLIPHLNENECKEIAKDSLLGKKALKSFYALMN